LNYQSLINAIQNRHSVRTFLPKALPSDTVEQVKAFASSLNLPFEASIRAEVFTAKPGKGLYNNGINPPNNIAFFSETDLISVSKTGFFGELVMLYIVSLGISTCWFGHYKLANLGEYFPNIATPERIKESTLGYGYGNHVDVGERAIFCMPFGAPDIDSKRLIDFIMKKKGGSRKPLSALLENPDGEKKIPDDIKEVFDLARLAPSAGNSQMWRFGYDGDTGTITVAKPVGYKHFKWEHSDVDIGICASHIWLGLCARGYSPQVFVRQNEDRAFWEFKL
jgi:nitroreductase